MANCYIFTGPEGIGKRLAAHAFVMGLYCEKGSACGECLPCQKFQHGTHPDVHFLSVLEDKKEISIDQVRAVQAAIQMKPVEGRYKMVLINNAEDLSDGAENSALKSLEEPPPATHFILITARPHLLLPTIVSRCQRIPFSPPSAGEAIPIIQEKAKVTAKMASFLYSASSGSIGLALSIPPEAVDEAVAFLKKMWEKILPSEIISASERWGKDSARQSAILAVINSIYRDILVCKTSGRRPSTGLIDSEMSVQAARLSTIAIQKKISMLASAQEDVEATYNKQLMFEQLLFGLAA